MSPEISLMLAPDRTYAALAARATRVGPVLALRRPLLAAVVLGVSVALSATGHVTPALAASATIMMSVVVIGQVLIALAMIGRSPSNGIGRARALDLFFASHAPWSFWMLASALWVPSVLALQAPLNAAAIVPAVVTPRMIAAYFRQVHGLDRRRAAVRTLGHQALTWGLFAGLFAAAVAIWPRILQVLS